MAGTLKLGSIPPLSVWHDEELNFKVESKLGAGANFTKRTEPAPAGEMQLDQSTGAFRYKPAKTDRQDITVWISAKKGPDEEQQKFTITPHARLNPEFKVIRHLADLPDKDEQTYITYAEEDAGKAIFNNTVDYDDEEKAKIETKNVWISGVCIILERNSLLYPLYDKLNDKVNLRRVTICADEIIIRNPLKLPGTDVYLYARILKFEGGREGGSIDTSPRAVNVRARTRPEGLKGQKAGDLHLYVQRVEMSEHNAGRYFLNGAKGQDASFGLEGKDGTSIPEWNGEASTETWWADHETLNWKPDFHQLEGYKPVFAQIWEYYPPGYKGPWYHMFDTGKNAWPGDATPPERLPGRPGRGGDGGTIHLQSFDWIRGRHMREPGADGAMAQDLPEKKGGNPQKACKVLAKYKKFAVPSTDQKAEGDGTLNRKIGLEFMSEMGAKFRIQTKGHPGAKAPGPNPDTPAGKHGGIVYVGENQPWFWLHQATVRALVPYVHDAMLAGHEQNKEVRDLLVIYRDTCEAAAEGTPSNNPEKLVWSTLHAQIAGLLQRADSPYDYYGNPAGWVPMLSFQTNLTLFHNETEDALRILFLSYWIEKTKDKERKAAKTLQAAIDGLAKEAARAEKDYEAAIGKITGLDGRAKQITGELETLRDTIEIFEANLKRITAENLRREHLLRGGAKIIGGVMQLIPVGQPVLAAFGKAGVALSDIDFDKPTKVAPDVLKAFAPLVQEKVSQKAKALFDSAKEGKAEVKKDADKEEFNKKLTEAKLKEKVENQLKEEKTIKNEIVEAFSSLAVKDSEVEERLAQVKADCPELKEHLEKVAELNKKKAAFVEELLAALQTVDEASAVLLNSQLATIGLRAERDVLLSSLSNGVLQYVQGMGERARRRLMKYQYYLLKSYHYLMLRDTVGIDFRALKLFESFAKELDKSNDGTLTSEQLKTLKAAFEDQIKNDLTGVIDHYQGNPPSLGGAFSFSLTDAELDVLNNSPNHRLDLDLMRRGGLDLLHENIRITSIEVVSVELVSPPAKGAMTVNLGFFHDGTSRLRRRGQLFLFRSGDYSVTEEAGAANEGRGGHSAHRLWGANVSYDNGTKKIEPMFRDPAAGSLLRYLIGEGEANRKKEESLYFRPAAWSGLRIQHSTVPVEADGSLKSLTLKVSYVSDAVGDNLASVLVRMPDDAEPLVRCTASDVNGCSDGQGTFLRTFDRNVLPSVTLSVPGRCGGRNFVHWRIVDKTDKFVNKPSLELDLKRAGAYTVEPIYAKEITPDPDK